MPVLNIMITVVDDTDWDGNPIQFKRVTATYDGLLPKEFSYPTAVDDVTIRTEVETKLRNEGYIP